MQEVDAKDQLSLDPTGLQAVAPEESSDLNLKERDQNTMNNVLTAESSPHIGILERDCNDGSAAVVQNIHEDRKGAEKKKKDNKDCSATGALVGAGATSTAAGQEHSAELRRSSRETFPNVAIKEQDMLSPSLSPKKTSIAASSRTSTPSQSPRNNFDADQPQSPNALPPTDGLPTGMSAPPPPTPAFPAFNAADVRFVNESLRMECYDPSQERALVDHGHVPEALFEAPLREAVGEAAGRMPVFFYPHQKQHSDQSAAPYAHSDDALPSVLDATTALMGDIVNRGGRARGYGENAFPSSSSMTPLPATLLEASSSLATRNPNYKKRITSDVSLVSSSLSSASAPSPGALDPFSGRSVQAMEPPLAQLLLQDFSRTVQFPDASDTARAGYGITPETSGHANTGVFPPLSLGAVPGTISPRENATMGDPLLLSGLQPTHFEAMSERLSGYHQQRPESQGSDLNLDTYSSSLSNIHVPPPYSSNNSVSALHSGETQSGAGCQLSIHKYYTGNERNALLLSPGREKDNSQERRRDSGDPRATFNTMETFQSHPLYQHAQHSAEGFSSMGLAARDVSKKTHDLRSASVIPDTFLSVSTANDAVSSSLACVPKFELSEEDVPIDVRSSLVVSYIPHSWTLKRLYDTFAPYGRVLQYRLDTDPETGKRKGRGFVQFDCPESAVVAMNAVNGMAVEDNRRLKVQMKRFMSPHYRQCQMLASAQYSESGPHQKWRFPVHSSNGKKAVTTHKEDAKEPFYQCRMTTKETTDLQYGGFIRPELSTEGHFTSPRDKVDGRMMTSGANGQEQHTVPAACGGDLFSVPPPLTFMSDATNAVHPQIAEEVSRVGSGSLYPQISSDASPIGDTDGAQSNASFGWLSSVLAVVDKAEPNSSRGHKEKEACAAYALWSGHSSVRNPSNTPSLSASSDSSASSSSWSITSGERATPHAVNDRERKEYDDLSPERGRVAITLKAVPQGQPRGSSEKPSIWGDRQYPMLPNLRGEEYSGSGGYHLIVQGSGSSPSEGPMTYAVRSRANSTHSPGSRMLGSQRKEVSMAAYSGQVYGDKSGYGSSSVTGYSGEQDLRCSAPKTTEEAFDSDILRMLLLPTAPTQGTHQRSASEGCCEASFIGDSVANDIGVGGVGTSSSSTYGGTHVGFQTPLSLRQQPAPAPWGNFFSSASGMPAPATSSATRGHNCGATPFTDTTPAGTTAAATLASYENHTRVANTGSSPSLPVNAHFVTPVYKGPGGNSDAIAYNTEGGTGVFQDQKLTDISGADGIEESLSSVRQPGTLPHDNKNNLVTNNYYYNQDKPTTIGQKRDSHDINYVATKECGGDAGDIASTLPYCKEDWMVHSRQQEMDSGFLHHRQLEYQQLQHNPWTNQQSGFQEGKSPTTGGAFAPQLHDSSAASLSFFSYTESGANTVLSNQPPAVYPDGQEHPRISVPGEAASIGMQQHGSSAPSRPRAVHGAGLRRAHAANIGSQVSGSSNSNPSRFSLTGSSGRYHQGTIIPDNNLFVFHIPPDWNEAEFRRQFKQFGQIRCLSFPKDFITPWGHKGYGFICYEFQEDALRAIREMDGKEIAVGRRLKVEFKKPLNPKLRAAATVAVNANPLLRRGPPVLWPRHTKKEGNLVNCSGRPTPGAAHGAVKYQKAHHPLPSTLPLFHTKVPMAPEYPHNPAFSHPVDYSLAGVRRGQEVHSSYTQDGQSTTAGCLATPSSVGFEGPLYAVNGE